jgi:hypothetical protein
VFAFTALTVSVPSPEAGDTATAPVNVEPVSNAKFDPHVKPVPDVYLIALFVPLQLGIATAVGDALDAVTFATTVFAACAASAVAVTFPHAGGVLGPVDTAA